MNEILKRTLFGAIYIFVLIAATILSQESFTLLFGIFMIMAVREYCSLVSLNKTIPILVATAIFILFYTITDKKIILGSVAISLFVCIKSIFLLFDKKITDINTLSKYQYLVGYVILPFIFITKIPLIENNTYNPKIIISIFVLIWTNDTFAYIFGKSIGKHKLFESVSPKKTLEGFFGGLIFTIFVGYLIFLYYLDTKQSFYIGIMIALIVSIFGTIGDLVESKFKRIANVKDSGSVLPGHGGILDRLDSMILISPIILLFYQIINYVS